MIKLNENVNNNNKYSIIGPKIVSFISATFDF
jgi:hypothetical protein